MTIFAYSSLWHIFNLSFIWYLWGIYIPTRRYIGRRGRILVIFVSRSFSTRSRRDQDIVIESKIGPSDPYSEASLSSLFLSSFPSLSPSSSPSSWFVIAPYVSSQQRPSCYFTLDDQWYCSISEYWNIIGLYGTSAIIYSMCHKLMVCVTVFLMSFPEIYFLHRSLV